MAAGVVDAMNSESTPAGGLRDGRAGALVDLAIWLAALALLGIGGSVIARVASKAGLWVWLLQLVPMAVLFLLSTWLLHRRGEGWRSVGLRAPSSFRRVAALVAAGYVGVVALNAALMLLVLPKLGIAKPSFGPFAAMKGHPVIFAYWLVFAWISAALGEELQFRGFVWSRLERLVGGGRNAAVPTLFAQAALFGVCHYYQGLAGILATGAAGLVLGVVYLAGRRNLVANMVLHGLVDTVSLTVLFLGLAPATLGG